MVKNHFFDKSRVLCLGPLWHGSNANALFKAFRRCGLEVKVIDEFHFIPLQAHHLVTKVVSILMRSLFTSYYNRSVLRLVRKELPNFIFVYKGAFIKPSTLVELRKHCEIYCFYPDVSMYTHGKYITRSIPLYSKVFTTKSFGVKDLKQQLNYCTSYFVPHGFDPDVHRKHTVQTVRSSQFICDVSFIGTWSPKKEHILSQVIKALPECTVKIWGSQWVNAQSIPAQCIMHSSVNGDEYAIAIQASKINLGLLSEKRTGASSGDKITSRTFHIPASGGFMIHERNNELHECFEPDKEVVDFDTIDELIDKIRYYLSHDSNRIEIATNGHKKVQASHSINHRAEAILNHIHETSIRPI